MIQTGRQVTLLWVAALAFAFVCGAISVALSPATPPQRAPASYYIGLVGLLGVGIAIWLTWRWLDRAGPQTHSTRVILRVALSIGGVLWVAAMLFPFL